MRGTITETTSRSQQRTLRQRHRYRLYAPMVAIISLRQKLSFKSILNEMHEFMRGMVSKA